MSRIGSEQPRAVWCCSLCGAIYHRDFPRCPADGAEVVMAPRDPLLDTAIGNYVIDKLVGEGGMGRVYLAHHANLPNKLYAFKVLLGDHSASTAMRVRFTREAERASQLEHPNVVKVVDFGQTTHGLLYIVMDYVDGPPLVSLIGDQPMAPARVVELAREICKGLVYAHEAGIVHRDLKPENILVADGPDGPVPRIVDFGLALSIDQSDARLTESGMTMGTPLFAAPEQLMGKTIDHRADLFALGMTMFEMLTGGMTPIEGHMMEVVSAKTTKDTPRPSERAPHLDIPAELDDIVARLTRRKPDDRYATAREVIDALDRLAIDPALGASAVRRGELVNTPGREGAVRREMPMRDGQRADAARSAGAEARIRTQPIALVRRPLRRGWVLGGVVAAFALLAVVWVVNRPPSASRAAMVAASPARRPTAQDGRAARTEPGELPLVANLELDSDASPARPAAGRRAVLAAPPATELGRAAASAVTAGAAPLAVIPAAPAAAQPAPTPPPAAARPAQRPAVRIAATAPAEPTTAPRMRAKLDGIDINGSLPVSAVQRAIERKWSAIAGCMPAAPATVIAHFNIGEARRAKDVRTTGSTSATSACIATAVGDVRTEAAPDVGDVEVTLRVAFVEGM